MRRLTILSVAYAHAPVGPDAVGGAEQILTALDQALVEAGHHSIVIACEGSTAAGTLLTYPPAPIGQAPVRQRIEHALACDPIDLIHMHGIDFHEHLPPPGPPLLATLHLPPTWYPPQALAPTRPGTWLHAVSRTQAASLPPAPHILPPIPNGVPIAQLAVTPSPRADHALILARICPEKGIHLALEAAHAADIPLLIGGEIFPHQAHQDYFRTQVAPLLDHRRQYLGPLGFARKRALLASARCLLIPSLASETSSLVAMEAAACGTPVIAYRAGALPEIIEAGRTGLLVDDVAGLVAALAQIHTIDPETCRKTATTRFDVRRMARAYLSRYAQLTHHKTIVGWASAHPSHHPGKNSGTERYRSPVS